MITVGHEWDSTLRSKSGTPEPGVDLSRSDPTGMDDSSGQPLYTILESTKLSASWRRGWGLRAVGSPHVLPHFAIRVTDNSNLSHSECLVLGVTRNKSVDSSAALNGLTQSCYALMSSKRSVWNGDWQFAERGITALRPHSPLSRLLATTDQMRARALRAATATAMRDRTDDISGGLIRGRTAVVEWFVIWQRMRCDFM